MQSFEAHTYALAEMSVVASVCGIHQPRHGCLLLHGAGTSNRHRLASLAEELVCDGLFVGVPDLPGAGDTQMRNGVVTLEARTRAATAIMDSEPAVEAWTIIAFSMSGETAVRLLEHYSSRITRIVLLAPAFYADQAYSLPFGPQFSTVIRQERSWTRSSCFSLIESFRGELVIVASNRDPTVPIEIPRKLWTHATNARFKNMIEIESDVHLFGKLCQDDARFRQTVATLARGLSGDFSLRDIA